MKKSIILILLFILITNLNALSQPPQRMGGVISGNVSDAELETPLEYANILLYEKEVDVLENVPSVNVDIEGMLAFGQTAHSNLTILAFFLFFCHNSLFKPSMR